MPALQSRRSSGMSAHGGGSPPGASRYRPPSARSWCHTPDMSASRRRVEKASLVCAQKGCLDRWPQLRKLPRLTLGFVLSELRHDFRGKEFQSFADVFVPVLPALLDKYRLVHTRILESAQRRAQFRGRADASGAPAEHLSAELITHRQIAAPDVGATGRVFAEDIVMRQCKLKEAESIRASTPSLFRVGVARKAGNHGDVRVDGVTDRHAFTSECLIVLRYPVPSLRGINEGKGERADPELRGQMNGLPIRTGHPNRRVGFLYWLGKHVARGHREVFAGEARVRVHHHHIGDLFDGLQPHRTTFSRVYTKPFEFRP